jgi:hypothetical protein
MRILARGGVTLLLFLCAMSICNAQAKLRRIEQPEKFIYPNTPIRVEVELNGKNLVGKEALAEPDWIQKLKVVVTNTSGKDISTFSINLTIREPVLGVTSPPSGSEGITIPVEMRTSSVKVLLAGESLAMSPSAELVEQWTKHIKSQGVDDIQKLILDIRQVGFTDGIVWTRGRLSRKDPSTGRYVFIGISRRAQPVDFIGLLETDVADRGFF